MVQKRNQLTLRLTNELNEQLMKKSEEMGVSKNAFILMILNKEVQKVS